MKGGIAYVMGPSGVGKDTLLGRARASLAGQPVLFAHRYITRPVHGDENFVALSAAEFDLRLQRDLFAMHWQAHGASYGIGREIDLWRRAGCLVVVSGSRAHFLAELAHDPDITPILVTAPPDVLARRLRARGRDDEASIAERLARSGSFAIAHSRLIEIRNDAAIADAARILSEALGNCLQATAPG
jgi:ribose 1,5-bisphosphokinase